VIESFSYLLFLGWFTNTPRENRMKLKGQFNADPIFIDFSTTNFSVKHGDVDLFFHVQTKNFTLDLINDERKENLNFSKCKITT
jgi:hypothetical protein